MMCTVNLQDKSQLATEEVNDETMDDMLSADLEILKPSTTKDAP
jgi:hypothetical protein